MKYSFNINVGKILQGVLNCNIWSIQSLNKNVNIRSTKMMLNITTFKLLISCLD